MAIQTCLFSTSSRDSARLFMKAMRTFGMDVSSESKGENEFYCELITVTDNSYSVSRHENVRAYAAAYQMKLLKINGRPVEYD